MKSGKLSILLLTVTMIMLTFSVSVSAKNEVASNQNVYRSDVAFSTENVTEEETAQKPGKPTLVSFECTGKSVTFGWSEVKGATGYRVYVKNPETAKWDIVIRSTGNKTTATISNLSEGGRYTFSVRAYRREGKIVWSPERLSVNVLTKPGVPEVTVSDRTKSSLKLSWNKVRGATGYRVYIRTSNSWKALKTTKNTFYTVDSLESGTSNIFAVRAYTKFAGKRYWAESFAKITDTTLPGITGKISAANVTHESVILKWKKVNGALGYRVYKLNSKTGKWVKVVKSTKNLSATVSNLSSSTQYTFAVKAYLRCNDSYIWSDGYKKITVRTNKNPSFTRKNYMQIHESWSDKIYGKISFAKSGCGIMSIVNAVYNLDGTFIHPHEIADWAYKNGLYNRGGSGGSSSRIVSAVSDKFGKKYGFRLVKSYTDYGTLKTSSSARKAMINHLLDGGTVVAHVYGHYLTVVDYDKDSGKFLVFDPYPGSYNGKDTGSRRYGYTTQYGDFKTAAELSVYPIDVDRFYLIDKY